MKKIIILCAGDFGREVAWLIENINKKNPTYEMIGFLDDDSKKIGQSYNGYECLGSIRDLMVLNENHNIWAVIAAQDSRFRKKFVEMFPDFSQWETLIHPSANISDASRLGHGCIICANCNISVNTIVGNQCIMNLGTTVGHDCKVEDYASFMSGTVISGHVQIGEGAYFGSNSTVLPGKKIGNYSKVGAGSVVIRNIRDGVSVMGVPATSLRL